MQINIFPILIGLMIVWIIGSALFILIKGWRWNPQTVTVKQAAKQMLAVVLIPPPLLMALLLALSNLNYTGDCAALSFGAGICSRFEYTLLQAAQLQNFSIPFTLYGLLLLTLGTGLLLRLRRRKRSLISTP